MTDQDASPDEKQYAIKRERLQQRDLPSTYVDTWSTLTWRGHIRMVLGEDFAEGSFYRAAFVMNLDQAEAFSIHLYGAVQKRKAKDEAAAKAKVEAEAGAVTEATSEAEAGTPEGDS